GPFSAFGREHQAAIGYLHAKTDFYSNNRLAQFPGLPEGVAPPVDNFNTWNPAAYPVPTWGAQARYQDSETTQQGLYGMARFSLTDRLKAIVGARVTKYEKSG
ncbi:TonB-dependent receptor domain-containing protein, partial [Acinetobacter baumannii]